MALNCLRTALRMLRPRITVVWNSIELKFRDEKYLKFPFKDMVIQMHLQYDLDLYP